ncbi:MAG TPA: asparagine synthase-related protein, partial [Steroidobacteraceae bacterium]|nr:asparagine synthase-related protein [Steroidobacteraceae bacterium]
MGTLINSAPGRWRLTFAATGLRVYCSGLGTGSNQAAYLTGNAGVILGAVFPGVGSGDDIPRRARFDDVATEKIIDSGGRELTERYWGRYVAFLSDPRDGSARVLRSPTGELDCLVMQIEGVRIFFSDTEGCPLPQGWRLSVDWDFVAAELTTLMAENRRTGLRELQRVLHGECLVIESGVIDRKQYWHPFRFVAEAPIENVASAARELHRVTRACIGAWASCHESALALLSGGLDSSIVVGLLGSLPARPALTCVNYRNPYDRVADEREYARRVADQAGLPLIEREQGADLDADRLLLPPGQMPSCEPGFAYPGDGWQSELARARQATACITGHGGDQLFFENGACYVCADFIHTHGLRPRMMSVAMEAARMEGGVFWEALRRGLQDGMGDDPLRPVIGQYFFSPLVRSEVVESVRRQRLFLPGWFETEAAIPPGKCWQIIGLSVH